MRSGQMFIKQIYFLLNSNEWYVGCTNNIYNINTININTLDENVIGAPKMQTKFDSTHKKCKHFLCVLSNFPTVWEQYWTSFSIAPRIYHIVIASPTLQQKNLSLFLALKGDSEK